MKKSKIRDVVRRCISAASDLAAPATLVEVGDTTYVPGFSPSRSATNWPVRMITGKALGGIGRMEEGPLLNDQAAHLGWLYSPDVTPAVGDEIHQDGETRTITKLGPLDHGAGVLFEVYFQ